MAKREYVACPLEPEKHRHAMSGGKLKVNSKEHLQVYRSSCLSDKEKLCIYCPNYNFDVVFRVIGEEKDFDWLKSIIRQIGLSLDCTIKHQGRTFDDCCTEHKDCIISEYEGILENNEVVTKESMKDAYNVIMAASDESPHEVVHVKATKWHGGFRLRIAMRSK